MGRAEAAVDTLESALHFIFSRPHVRPSVPACPEITALRPDVAICTISVGEPGSWPAGAPHDVENPPSATASA